MVVIKVAVSLLMFIIFFLPNIFFRKKIMLANSDRAIQLQNFLAKYKGNKEEIISIFQKCIRPNESVKECLLGYSAESSIRTFLVNIAYRGLTRIYHEYFVFMTTSEKALYLHKIEDGKVITERNEFSAVSEIDRSGDYPDEICYLKFEQRKNATFVLRNDLFPYSQQELDEFEKQVLNGRPGLGRIVEMGERSQLAQLGWGLIIAVIVIVSPLLVGVPLLGLIAAPFLYILFKVYESKRKKR